LKSLTFEEFEEFEVCKSMSFKLRILIKDTLYVSRLTDCDLEASDIRDVPFGANQAGK